MEVKETAMLMRMCGKGNFPGAQQEYIQSILRWVMKSILIKNTKGDTDKLKKV